MNYEQLQKSIETIIPLSDMDLLFMSFKIMPMTHAIRSNDAHDSW